MKVIDGKDTIIDGMSFSADCTRPVESHEKPHPNCFAVGPLVDDGAIRTYYISCRELNN